ncbi:dirigent protein 23-like [Oryza glaberrima]|uniref:dirigent protein 23-like n=1 Tax=Oryza glaberrima TaxID=4538 RepID=UPI00224C579C|nr:dirigent protein 23-like [Oryza glaberrima]
MHNELYMHLYINQTINQTISGPNPNQLVVVNGSQQAPLFFGLTAISDWTILDGPGPNASVVGRAQGMHFQSGHIREKWYTSMNFLFEDTRFNGSMLQVMGTTPQDDQWAILGGTGEFVAAEGIVEHKIVQTNCNSRKLGA